MREQRKTSYGLLLKKLSIAVQQVDSFVRKKVLALLVVSGLIIVCVAMVGPVPQDLSYHFFADQRQMLGVPNGFNVLSNIAFLLVGFFRLRQLKLDRTQIFREQKQCLTLFFAGFVLTAFGSSWDHLDPSNNSLMWDRLAMSLTFVAIFIFVFIEFIDTTLGFMLLWPLVLIGLGSVMWWKFSEQLGNGDLRPYIGPVSSDVASAFDNCPFSFPLEPFTVLLAVIWLLCISLSFRTFRWPNIFYDRFGQRTYS